METKKNSNKKGGAININQDGFHRGRIKSTAHMPGCLRYTKKRAEATPTTKPAMTTPATIQDMSQHMSFHTVQWKEFIVFCIGATSLSSPPLL